MTRALNIPTRNALSFVRTALDRSDVVLVGESHATQLFATQYTTTGDPHEDERQLNEFLLLNGSPENACVRTFARDVVIDLYALRSVNGFRVFGIEFQEEFLLQSWVGVDRHQDRPSLEDGFSSPYPAPSLWFETQEFPPGVLHRKAYWYALRSLRIFPT